VKDQFSKVRFIIAIAAGKGGVGKSTITTLIASAMQKKGYAVGVFDADLYGPSLGQMISQGDIKIFSLPKEQPLHVRAPVVNNILLDAIDKVEWGELDYLFIDFPPGTGDIQLTLLQNIPFSGALLVTLPSKVSVIDVRKAAKMFPAMGVPLLGVIENMSYYKDKDSLEKKYFFGQKGGEGLALELQVPLLAEIPIEEGLCECLDVGKNFLTENEQSDVSEIIEKMSFEMHKSLCEGMKEFPLIKELLQNISAKEIQKRCPCESCKQKTPSQISDDVEIVQVRQMGRYALHIEFSSGCKRGLYPLSLLQDIQKGI
jgi:ATP-binding protein involved in chromosome partitioning